MAKTIHVKKPADWKRVNAILKKGLLNPFKNTRGMFLLLGAMIDRDTQLTFKGEGSYQGRPKWIGFGKGRGVGVYLQINGKYAKRPGTDGSKRRRYSTSSKLLQASTRFKQSFRILKIGRNKMLYGTKHKLAEDIMSNPTRPALYYTEQDQKRYSRVVFNWWSRHIKL